MTTEIKLLIGRNFVYVQIYVLAYVKVYRYLFRWCYLTFVFEILFKGLKFPYPDFAMKYSKPLNTVVPQTTTLKRANNV